jgi:choline-sulfatase
MELTRSQFLRAAAAVPSLGPPSAAQQAQRPNVLILMTDQHRHDYLGGNELVPTPNIDRIASRGVRFTSACCPYPVCAASRMSLLTGLYSHTHGVINNTDLLDWRARTMAHHFAEAGYLTGLIGKMHFNDAHTHGFHYHLGFNDWFMYLGPKMQLFANEIANHPIGPQFFHSMHDDGSGLPELPDLWGGKSPWAGHVKRMEDVGSEMEAEDHFDSFVARESSKFLRRYKDQPFFLIASFLKPHPPLHPPREWAARYPVEKMTLPPVGDISKYPQHIRQRIARMQSLGQTRLRQHRAGYLGNLAYVDTCVGQVYRTLEQLGLAHNTVVIYTSDHGDMDGDHGLMQKFCLFEPSVPCARRIRGDLSDARRADRDKDERPDRGARFCALGKRSRRQGTGGDLFRVRAEGQDAMLHGTDGNS